MEDNKKYYTPKLVEMHLGYEYEQCWNDHEDVWTKEKVDERWCIRDAEISLEHGGLIRTLYLSQECIEECGWSWSGDKDYGQKYYKIVGDIYWVLHTEWGGTEITIQQYNDGLAVEYRYITKYDGECPSKNELVTLMRWLKITQ